MDSEAGGRRLSWLVRLVLAGLIAVDALIIIGDAVRGEGVSSGTLGSAVVVIAFCMLVWYGLSWGRWPLVVVIGWRIFPVGRALASSFAPGDVMRLGALAAVVFYLGAAVILASPLAAGTRVRSP